MNRTLAILLLLSASAGVGAEIIAIVMSDRLVRLMEGVEERVPPPAMWGLATLSILYLAAMGLMAFSGDDIFRTYALVLVVLAAAGWMLRKILRRTKMILMIDSTICLVILLDVVRTVIRILSAGG